MKHTPTQEREERHTNTHQQKHQQKHQQTIKGKKSPWLTTTKTPTTPTITTTS